MAVGQVGARPDRREGRHVVGPERGDLALAGQPEPPAEEALPGELQDVGPEHPVTGQGLVHLDRDRAEVLAHDHGTPLGGRQGQAGEELLVGIADVGAAGRHLARPQPEQALEAEDVVDAQQPGMAEVVLEAGAHVAVTGLPGPLGVQRREPPVLAEREEEVGRGADAGIAHEAVLVVPDVEAVGVGADRQVEGEELAAALDPLGQRRQLTLHHPLGVEVEALDLCRALAGRQPAAAAVRMAQPLRPGPPVRAVAGGHRPEAGVAGGQREGLDEAAIAGVARPRRRRRRPAPPPRAAPASTPRPPGSPGRPSAPGAGAPPGSALAVAPGEVVEIGVELVPGTPAERRRRGCTRRGVADAVELGGQEGQRHDGVARPGGRSQSKSAPRSARSAIPRRRLRSVRSA